MSLAEKNKEAAKKWHDMASAEKEKFKHSAQSLKSPNVLELSDTQRSKLIDVHRKNLLNEVRVSVSLCNNLQPKLNCKTSKMCKFIIDESLYNYCFKIWSTGNSIFFSPSLDHVSRGLGL